MFADRSYFDSAKLAGGGDEGDFASIYVAGTLTGEGVAYPNNSVLVNCEKARMECLTYSVEAIGPMQIGRLEAPAIFKIKTWNKTEVVAVGDTEGLQTCVNDTITFDRSSESVLWVEVPINLTEPKCKYTSTKIRKWTIEDSPAWKALNAAERKSGT
jgi:hypothetical protein